jgi:hypothetical protein
MIAACHHEKCRPSTSTMMCRPLPPDVFGHDLSPCRGRKSRSDKAISATNAQSNPSPGSRPNTHKVGKFSMVPGGLPPDAAPPTWRSTRPRSQSRLSPTVEYLPADYASRCGVHAQLPGFAENRQCERRPAHACCAPASGAGCPGAQGHPGASCASRSRFACDGEISARERSCLPVIVLSSAMVKPASRLPSLRAGQR